jgi:hypothetical protein
MRIDNRRTGNSTPGVDKLGIDRRPRLRGKGLVVRAAF